MARSATSKGVQTRQRIVDAAGGLMSSGGADGLTMAAIAQAAGVSKGSVYYYFPDCEAVEREVLLDTFDAVVARFERAAAGAVSAHDALARIVDEYVAMLRENAPLMRLALGQTRLTPALRGSGLPGFDELSERLRRLVATQLQRGKAEGAVRPSVDAELAGAAIIGVFVAMTADRLACEGSDDVTLAASDYAGLRDALLDFIVLGVGDR